MTRPLYGSSLAPKDDGGLYDVVHLCSGQSEPLLGSGWTYADAVSMAGMENRLQAWSETRYCAEGEACIGFVVWRGER